jgi:hypothetical protein
VRSRPAACELARRSSCIFRVIGQRLQVRDQHGLLVIPLKRYPGSQRSGIVTEVQVPGWAVAREDDCFLSLASKVLPVSVAGLVAFGR